VGDSQSYQPVVGGHLDGDPTLAVDPCVLDKILDGALQSRAVARHLDRLGRKDIHAFDSAYEFVEANALIRWCGRLLTREREETIGKVSQPTGVLAKFRND